MAAHRVVIVGGGFGGLYAAKTLRDDRVALTIVDRKNHHTFQPLLYQVATAALNPSDIATPIRHILRARRNVEVILAEVERVDLDDKKLFFKDAGELAYDSLILAPGATHSYFGHAEWERFAPGLKTIEDALEMRKRIFFAYEAAERESEPERRRAFLTFVVVGGGPTGVELAGALAEIAKKTLENDFHNINPADARVILLEGSDAVLSTYVPPLREKARAQLEKLGVDVQLSARVTAIDEWGVTVEKNGKTSRIEARTVLWGAGVRASPLLKSLGVPLDRAGRVTVEPDLTLPGHPEVAVIGDAAAIKQGEGLVPGVAPAAIQGGRHAARNILRVLSGQERLPFRYLDKGSLATIGRAAGIADFGKLKLSGFLAWLSWLFIHLLFLIGFRNRFLVIIEWALSYVTYNRGARLITGSLPASAAVLSMRRPPVLDAPPAAPAEKIAQK
ncbi:MAG: NAD(P)/FAD-dependent oxidoreductase [Byssovorax sp.]